MSACSPRSPRRSGRTATPTSTRSPRTCEWLLERGLDGVFVGGTTGEGVLLEPDEVVALVERAVAVAGGERVIAQVGRPSTRATVALLERAYAAGAGAAAAYVPWFYPATDDQVRRHFLALLAVAGRPRRCSPTRSRACTSTCSRRACWATLAAAGLAGMKDSTGDPECHRAFVAAVAGRPVPHLHRQRRARARRDPHRRVTARSPRWPAARPGSARGARRGRSTRATTTAAERASAALAAEKDALAREGAPVAAIKRRVRAALAERGVDYPAAPRAPLTSRGR